MRKLQYFVFAMMCSNAIAESEHGINLNKLYYHQGIFFDSVVCYFDKSPQCIVKEQENIQKRRKEVDFFLPNVCINCQSKNMVDQLNSMEREYYSIKVTEAMVPEKGVVVHVSYDKDKIACQYAPCHSISMQNGLVFSLHNKEIIKTMHESNNSVLQSVCNDNEEIGNKKKYIIALDCGHGGTDMGTVGKFNICEKDINMSLGNQLANLLREKGFDVLLTRSTDIFVPLDMRTSHANKMRADLFVSIHANYGPEVSNGIETYWMDKSALSWQAIDSEDNQIHSNLLQLSQASELLAHSVHNSVLRTIATQFSVKDRSVKHGKLSQVLFGSQMPAVLIEVGFLSHQQEAQNLKNPIYQELIARGICSGIELYCTKKIML